MIDIRTRKTLSMLEHWPIDAVSDYYGLLPEHIQGIEGKKNTIDRFSFEKKLTYKGLTSLELVSLSFGIPIDPLVDEMSKSSTFGLPSIGIKPYGENGKYLILKEVAESWVKSLLSTNKLFYSLSDRAVELAKILKCKPRPCQVSKRFKDKVKAVATCRCIVTWDDISISHQEYLSNKKPSSLHPDYVGWHALYDDPSLASDLWRKDLTNFQNYLSQKKLTWSGNDR